MKTQKTCSAEDAVRQFGQSLGGAPDRIQVQVDAQGGVDHLCAVEAAIIAQWPDGVAKELVWLTRGDAAEPPRLQMSAFDVSNALVGEAVFILRAVHDADAPAIT